MTTIQECRALRSASLQQARALRAAMPRQASASIADLMRAEAERLEAVAAECRRWIDHQDAPDAERQPLQAVALEGVSAKVNPSEEAFY